MAYKFKLTITNGDEQIIDLCGAEHDLMDVKKEIDEQLEIDILNTAHNNLLDALNEYYKAYKVDSSFATDITQTIFDAISKLPKNTNN